MKLAAKISLALLLCVAVLLFQAARAHTEDATLQFANDMVEDAVGTARLLRPTVARAWRTEGKAAALYLIQYTNETLKTEAVASKMRVRWVWLSADTPDATKPRVALEKLSELSTGHEVSQSIVDDAGAARLYTYVPVNVGIDGEPPGALEVSESLTPITRFREASERRTRRAALTLGGVATVVIALVGFLVVGRPVRELTNTAGEIGDGNLGARAAVRGRDELGTLAKSINSMAARLEAGREEAEKQTEARIAVLKQLRHADRLKSVGTFASGIAHELGTPLAVVSGRARLIAEGTVSGEEVVKYAESIAAQSDKMATIIRGLLDFARQRNVTMTTRNLGEFVRETMNLLTPMARSKNVTFELVQEANDLELNVDGVQLQQVLTNLVVNAIDAMSEGGQITIRTGLRMAAPPPEHGGTPGDFVYLDVIDEGDGIKPDDLVQLFEPFFTTKPVGRGTGLGLAVSHGIIAEHSGWIEAASEVGHGSRFSVYLPQFRE